MEASFTRTIITNPDELFGRTELLNQLITLANNKYCVSINGLRRFGKTSLLKSLENKIKQNKDSKVYVVYFDFKEVGALIKGTNNAYKYMIAVLVSSLSKDKLFESEVKFGKIRIHPSSDWRDIFEQLDDVSSARTQGLLEDIIIFFSDLTDKTILFLIDEYEWLFKYTFDTPVGFMKLRTLSSGLLPNGKSPFCFWIVGAISWDYLCTLTGSGELNVIDAPPMYLGSIDYDSFQLMWRTESEKSEILGKELLELGDFAYHGSGGVPFYGKVIANYFIATKKRPNYLILNSHLTEMIGSLQNGEIQILNELAIQPRNFNSSRFLNELLEKGLIKKTGNSYELKSRFLMDFLRTKLSTETDTHKDPMSYVIADRISSLIININSTHKNKCGTYIFEPVNDDAALFKDLRTPCYTIDVFSDFASSLYKTIFERTKSYDSGFQKDITLRRLPRSFKKNNQFLEIVDIMRHSLGGAHISDTFTPRPNQLAKPKMLELLLGTRNEPNTPEEFYKLQIETLKMFELELQKLNALVRL